MSFYLLTDRQTDGLLPYVGHRQLFRGRGSGCLGHLNLLSRYTFSPIFSVVLVFVSRLWLLAVAVAWAAEALSAVEPIEVPRHTTPSLRALYKYVSLSSPADKMFARYWR